MSQNEVIQMENQGGYEPPRIITHTAERLQRVSLEVNACTAGFLLRRGPDAPDEGTGRDEDIRGTMF